MCVHVCLCVCPVVCATGWLSPGVGGTLASHWLRVNGMRKRGCIVVDMVSTRRGETPEAVGQRFLLCSRSKEDVFFISIWFFCFV